MKRTIVIISTIVAFAIILTSLFIVSAGEELYYGDLSVINGKLCDSSGKPVQLRGLSSNGLQWNYSRFLNYDSMKFIRDNWKANVFRAAMYTNEGGYITNPDVKNKVEEIIEAAKKLDVYVIVDWHILSDNNPNLYKKQALGFFGQIADKYRDDPHVLFEICNEPNGKVTWKKDIKPYAEDLIKMIRKKSKNIVIVGSSSWSQDINIVNKDRLSGSNIMYSFHFDASSTLFNRVEDCIASGLPIFVSEWRTCDSSKNGEFNAEVSNKWIDMLNSNQISWINWSLCDKAEAASLLIPGANTKGDWTDNELSLSGKLVKSRLITAYDDSNTKSPLQIFPKETPPPIIKPVKKPTPVKIIKTTPSIKPSIKPSITAVLAPSATLEMSPTPVATLNGKEPETDTIPSLGLEMFNGSTIDIVDNIYPKFLIKNKSDTKVVLDDFKIRYYFTVDSDKQQIFWCDHAGLNSDGVLKDITQSVTGKILKLDVPKDGADCYVEVGFKGAVEMSPEGYVQIQTRLAKQDWSNYIQSNDYSFNPNSDNFSEFEKITLLYKDSTILGKSPQ